MYKQQDKGDEIPAIPVGISDKNCLSTKDGWCCTLDLGHSGFHAAHADNEQQPEVIWDEPDSPMPIDDILEHAKAIIAHLERGVDLREVNQALAELQPYPEFILRVEA